MARKVDPNSVSYLKRQVRELVAVNEAFADKLGESAKLLCDHEETIERQVRECQEAHNDARQWKERRQESSDYAQKAAADARRYEEERDALRKQVEVNHEVRNGIERERDEARTLAHQMRLQAFPRGPQFPWEGHASFSAERVFHENWK